MGRLWTFGPQMFHGCSTDPAWGTGPLKHGDRLVQTLSAVFVGGPYISSTHATGISDVIGQLRTAARRSVLVTGCRSHTPTNTLSRPPIFLKITKIMDHSYWTTAEPRAKKTYHLLNLRSLWERQQRSPRPTSEKPDGETGNEKERERGRDRTSQSKLSWSLTITSHTFPLPPPFAYFWFLTLCFLCFPLWSTRSRFPSHFSLFPPLFVPLFWFYYFICFA